MQKPKSIIAQIDKNVREKKWKCMARDCEEIAINSHLIQRNGILSNISTNGHVVELKVRDVNRWEGYAGSPLEFKHIGIRQALSHMLFCNKHDTEIFRSIENENCDLSTYKAFVLFSYRATCAEIRKKELNIEKFSRMRAAETLSHVLDKNLLSEMINGNTLGMVDLKLLKQELEYEMDSPNYNFQFFSSKHHKIDIYASSIFSATSLEETKVPGEPDFKNYFFHVLPLESELLLLVGFNVKYSDSKMLDFCKSWMNIEFDEFQKKLSSVLINNIENWGMSIPLYNQISKRNLDIIISEVHKRMLVFGVDSETDYNIFS